MIDLDDLIAEARKAQSAVYLVTEKLVADDLSRIISTLADALEAAEAERDAALARITEAAKLHQPQPGQGVRYCADCDQRWPCPTAVSLGLNEGENDD